ncbi:MAG: EF-hand domain-containing protein [Thiobacillus sp.]|jgi:Ca2+-binding EF-hand superfamily protein|uniref:EF-hand domain-containing protein n=1 Tax=Thiobacillus sp. TaxID=924 RepID=UPI002893C05B|nr:EF-hand domain-containing protein [Thiobacillus sp.]MDT3706037.1 EF-hand domain-containing protein [Thiobacillus sp.]
MNPINRSLLNLTLATVLSTLAVGTALAQSAAKAEPVSFKDYDANRDGMVSQEEFGALGGSDQTFRKADANSDGMLSIEEFAKIGGARS